MIRSTIVALIVVLGATTNPAQAAQGPYKPGYKPRYEPRPSAPATYRPQGERPKSPTLQPAPKRPTFSAPPAAPTKSYTPPGSR